MKKALVSILLLLSACAGNNGSGALRAESLISSADEKIFFPISDAASVKTIEQWVASSEVPSTVQIACKDADKACKNVKALLKKRKISYVTASGVGGEDGVGSLSMTYSRINAKDCGTVSFGCATSVNSLKMVTNREQFVKPALSDLQDAAGAVRAINKSIR